MWEIGKKNPEVTKQQGKVYSLYKIECYANFNANVGEEYLMTQEDMSPKMNSANYVITCTSNPGLFFKKTYKVKVWKDAI